MNSQKVTCQEIVVRLSGVWEGISLEIIGLWCHLGFPTQCTALLCSILCTIYPSFQIDAQNARQLLSPDLFPSFYQRMWCTFRECHSESVNPSLLLQHLIYYKTSPSCINWTSPKLHFGVHIYCCKRIGSFKSKILLKWSDYWTCVFHRFRELPGQCSAAWLKHTLRQIISPGRSFDGLFTVLQNLASHFRHPVSVYRKCFWLSQKSAMQHLALMTLLLPPHPPRCIRHIHPHHKARGKERER